MINLHSSDLEEIKKDLYPEIAKLKANSIHFKHEFGLLYKASFYTNVKALLFDYLSREYGMTYIDIEAELEGTDELQDILEYLSE